MFLDTVGGVVDSVVCCCESAADLELQSFFCETDFGSWNCRYKGEVNSWKRVKPTPVCRLVFGFFHSFDAHPFLWRFFLLLQQIEEIVGSHSRIE